MIQEEEDCSTNTEIKEEEGRSIPSLYKMELTKGYFNTAKENQDAFSPILCETQNLPVEKSQEQEETFNSWKTKNRALNPPQLNESKIDMVSNLGRSLKQCQYVVTKTSPYCEDFMESKFITSNMESVANNCAHEMEYSSRGNHKTLPYSCEQQKNRFFELHQNPYHYCEHSNFHTPIKCEERYIPSPPIASVPYDNSPPVSYQPFDIVKKKLPQFPPSREIYSSDTSPCNHFHQSRQYGKSCVSPVLFTKHEDECHKMNQSSQRHQTNERQRKCSLDCTSKCKKSSQKEIQKNKQITDLYRIVYLQNQQLGLLQKQVQKLIELTLKDDNSSNNQENGAVLNKKYVKGTKEKRTFNLKVIKENEKAEEKVSVGIMTSFVENNYTKLKTGKEIKVFPKNSKSSNSSSDCDESSDQSSSETDLQPPAIHRINQQGTRGDKNNISFTLNDVIVPSIEDNPPSPQTSMQIEMQEYKSSSSTESDSGTTSCDSDSKSPPPIGWTFYDKVVGKVNDMLKQSLDRDGKESSEDDVRNATLDHLRQLGVSFVEPESPVTKRVTFNNRKSKPKVTNRQLLQCDSETSLHMNALANKYLKNNIISNAYGTVTSDPKCQNNLSHATLKYLERYHLSPNDGKKEIEKPEKLKKKKKKRKEVLEGIDKVQSRQNKYGKILDITAIKKQPKLLPKNN